MKTDPQNSDYVVESGAARNFEPWRGEDEVSILSFARQCLVLQCQIVPVLDILNLLPSQIVDEWCS